MLDAIVVNHRERRTAERVRALQRASYACEAELIRDDRMPPLLETTEDVIGLSLTILAVEDGPEIVGVVGYVRTGDVVEIDRLAVSPARFREGIGRGLLGAVHRREHDARRFEVSTGADNAPALRLYATAGYSPVRTERRDGVAVVDLVRNSDEAVVE